MTLPPMCRERTSTNRLKGTSMKPSEGTVVKADFGDGEEFALVVKHGDDKDCLVALGGGKLLSFREPQDRDDKGSGLTYWTA